METRRGVRLPTKNKQMTLNITEMNLAQITDFRSDLTNRQHKIFVTHAPVIVSGDRTLSSYECK